MPRLRQPWSPSRSPAIVQIPDERRPTSCRVEWRLRLVSLDREFERNLLGDSARGHAPSAPLFEVGDRGLDLEVVLDGPMSETRSSAGAASWRASFQIFGTSRPESLSISSVRRSSVIASINGFSECLTSGLGI
jgi:hypothetical protein